MKTRVVAGRLHAWVYATSGGRVGARVGGHPVLLLTTTGRRTGRPRTTPVQYERFGHRVVVAAAAGGSPSEPAWCGNLRANADVVLQMGNRVVPGTARVAEASERAELWRAVCERNPALAGAERKAGREIPLVVLDVGVS
jgi:deazaflavin-dependent oxidoreductase (nitroreductase family)